MSALVDTSVWIDHLRGGDHGLTALLEADQVVCHPFVIGELACGNLQGRAEILKLLGRLVQLPLTAHVEVLHLLELRKLMGRGLGWIDLHLLAAATLAGVALVTRDKALGHAAMELGLDHH